MSPPELMDEMVEEVLLRFPPREPACLAGAALVCKYWRRLISDPGFRRRFDEFHPKPKMLGFLCNIYSTHMEPIIARFVPTVSSSCSPLAADGHSWRAEDARHGRVLLSRESGHNGEYVLFMVWDPITGWRQELPAMLRTQYQYRWKSALIHCAATGTCNHLDCRRRPFHVVYMSSCIAGGFTCTYSSEAAAWSEPISANLATYCGSNNTLAQSVLVGKALYFIFDKTGTLAIKYDCELCKVVSAIPLPGWSRERSVVLITMEDGGLGCAALLMYTIYMWSRKGDYKVDNGWLKTGVIDLQTTLRIDTLSGNPWIDLVGFADGNGTVFLRMNHVLFAVDLKTNEVKEVYNDRSICSVVPYMGFCTPGASLLCS